MPGTCARITVGGVALATILAGAARVDADRPAAVVVGPPVAVPLNVGNEPTFAAAALVAPASAHGWLMIGDYRSSPGAVSQVVVYTSEPGQSWSLVANSGETGAESYTSSAHDLPDGRTAVFGAIAADTDEQPAVWTFDGTTVSTPTVIGDPASPGYVVDAAVGPDATQYALIARVSPDGINTFEVASLPTGAASWTVAPLATDDRRLDLYGIDVIDSTVVVTGDAQPSTSTNSLYDAAAFVSADRGATFRRADTSALSSTARSTYLGEVVANSDGFYAAACLASDDEFVNGYAYSSDGSTWQPRPFSDPSDTFSSSRGTCSHIAVDDGGGVWLSLLYGGGYALRTVDGVLDRYAELPRRDSTIFEGSPLIAVDGTSLAVAGPQNGGVLAGVAAGDSTRVDPGAGPPVGHETFSTFSVADAQGTVVVVRTYPSVAELPDGSYVSTSHSYPLRVGRGAALTGDPNALPVDPYNAEPFGQVFTLASGTFAVGAVLGPDAENADYFGGIGDVAISGQATDATWGAVETVASGAGSQFVESVALVGDSAAVLVGSDWVDDQTSAESIGGPLVVVTDGTMHRRIDIAVPDARRSGLSSVCVLPDGRVVAFGDDSQNRVITAFIDPVAGTATVATPVIDSSPTSFGDCAAAADGVIVEAQTANGPTVLSTVDGVTFTPVAALTPQQIAVAVAGGPAGVAVVGRAGGTDAFVAVGPSIAELAVVDAPTLHGPGRQEAFEVAVGADEVHVYGTINDAPVVWPITIP